MRWNSNTKAHSLTTWVLLDDTSVRNRKLLLPKKNERTNKCLMSTGHRNVRTETAINMRGPFMIGRPCQYDTLVHSALSDERMCHLSQYHKKCTKKVMPLMHNNVDRLSSNKIWYPLVKFRCPTPNALNPCHFRFNYAAANKFTRNTRVLDLVFAEGASRAQSG